MMSKSDSKEAAAVHPMERRMIHVETMPDQAGIAAALRRAFSAAPVHEEDADDMFEDLLRRLH